MAENGGEIAEEIRNPSSRIFVDRILPIRWLGNSLVPWLPWLVGREYGFEYNQSSEPLHSLPASSAAFCDSLYFSRARYASAHNIQAEPSAAKFSTQSVEKSRGKIWKNNDQSEIYYDFTGENGTWLGGCPRMGLHKEKYDKAKDFGGPLYFWAGLTQLHDPKPKAGWFRPKTERKVFVASVQYGNIMPWMSLRPSNRSVHGKTPGCTWFRMKPLDLKSWLASSATFRASGYLLRSMCTWTLRPMPQAPLPQGSPRAPACESEHMEEPNTSVIPVCFSLATRSTRELSRTQGTQGIGSSITAARLPHDSLLNLVISMFGSAGTWKLHKTTKKKNCRG